MKVTKLIRTCDMCPSQWEGIDENDHSIYIRYRWGTLLVYRSKQPSTDISAALDGDLVLDLKLGHDYDGYLDYETTMKESLNVKQNKEKRR